MSVKYGAYVGDAVSDSSEMGGASESIGGASEV